MDKRKTTLMGGSVLVLALVAALGIVYAAYSQSLTINGTASVKANSWDIHFTNLQPAKITGSAQEITAPVIKNNSTVIGDYSVLLSKPGDSIEYTFKVENGGTFPAELTDVLISKPTCTGTGDDALKDAENVCKYLIYDYDYIELFYSNGTSIENNDYSFMDFWDYNDYLNRGNLTFKEWAESLLGINLRNLESKDTVSVTIKLTYSDNVPADELPKNDVAISNLGASLVYTQVK